MYGHITNSRLRQQTLVNLRHLTKYLASVPKIKVQLRFGYAWGEECRYFGPGEYRDVVIAGAQSLLSNGVDLHVHIRTHPRFMDQWVDLLVSSIFRVMSLYFVFRFKMDRKIGSSF